MSHVRHLLLLLVPAVACSSSPDAPRATPRPAATVRPATPAVPTTPSPAARTVAPPPTATVIATPDAAASAAPSPTHAPSPTPTLRPGEQRYLSGDMPLDVEISPVCGPPGTVMRARIRTEPRAQLAAVARYSDGSAHDDFTWGDATETGDFVWTWMLKPEIPSGQAVIYVTASIQGGRGASAEAAFEVRSRC